MKHLLQLDSAAKQDAEIAIYFGRFDEAEALYKKLDRMDLAIDMRMRFGEWFTVGNITVCSAAAVTPINSMCSACGKVVHAFSQTGSYHLPYQHTAHCYRIRDMLLSLFVVAQPRKLYVVWS